MCFHGKELEKEKLAGKWKKSQQKKLSKVMTYLSNHNQYINYDHYLAQGYELLVLLDQHVSHVVKDRMEISGARWGINGAESILKLRSVEKSKDWDNYW